MPVRIAIMQPYFLPYAGYFRLFRNVDAFVASDLRLFPRRGWVHRNRLHRFHGPADWFGLPIRKAPQTARIADLEFTADADERMARERERFVALKQPSATAERLVHETFALETNPSGHILKLIRLVNEALRIDVPIVLASELPRELDLRREEGIYAMCRHLGATHYVNAPGGRDLYDPAEFRRRGIELQFLPDYGGPMESILQRLHDDGPDAVRCEIDRFL